MRKRQTVFLLGLEEFHRPLLEALPAATECRFEVLLSHEQLRRTKEVSSLLDAARRQLDAHPGPVGGIGTYWDFPASSLVPILAAERDLPHVPLDAVLRCEHKYWSRLEQRKVVPDHVPRFCLVDPFDDAAAERIDIDYPFWLKPIKSHSSYLGFRIDGRDDFAMAVETIRREIHTLAEPFNEVLRRADLPSEIRPDDGYRCIAEEIISEGRQCTLEGFGFQGKVVVYGTVDSHRFSGYSTFSGYQYPSSLPEAVQQRMAAVASKVMEHIGYDGGAFNIEFFWDEDDDQLWLLEINARVSQSHSDLFANVDGVANLSATVDLALGREPRLTYRRGRFPLAAKFYIRQFSDGVVQRVPSPQEMQALERDVPPTRVQVLVDPGARLSESARQDSYSYELAWVYTAGHSEAELERKFQETVRRLDIRVDPEHEQHAAMQP